MASTEPCCDPTDPMDCEERATCPQAGESGHTSCGTCPEHQRPRHTCGCFAQPVARTRTND